MIPESIDSESYAWDERKHLDQLEDERLIAVPDHVMVSEILQRKYLADLRLKDKWKKQNNSLKRKLRFKRPK